MIAFTVPGEPKSQGRPRFARMGQGVCAYKDSATEAAETHVGLLAWTAMNGADPLSGPLTVRIRAFRAKGRPTSKVGRKRAESGLLRPVTRPDLDNYAKMVLDGLNGVAYVDDAQIVALEVSKHFSERPRVEVEIEAWAP